MKSDVEITNYDNIADLFLTHIDRPNSWNNIYERPNMIARLPDLKDKNVLDIGCASGYYSEFALKHGAAVTAVDGSQVMIDKLSARVKSPKLQLFRADISQTIPFLKADSFDVVICSLVIDYIKDWTVPLGEFYRVLRKGGRVVMATHHPFGQFLYLRKHHKLESYFAFKMIEDTWSTNGRNPFKTHFYIRPLNEALRPIINSNFKIISIDEPLPDDKCKKTDIQVYERLMDRPGFLFFVLEK